MRAWELPKDIILFEQGAIGSSCFIVVRGAVAVSIHIGNALETIRVVPAGGILGQVAMIEGEPRSATCCTQSDAVLLEIDREACHSLFAHHSATAVKFFAVLNEGVVRALRISDRRLMQVLHERPHATEVVSYSAAEVCIPEGITQVWICSAP